MYYDIFLDTNVIQSSSKEDLEALEFYVKKTWRKAYVCKITIDELFYNYTKNAESYREKYKATIKESSRFDVNSIIPTLNFDDLSIKEKFIQDYIQKKFSQINFMNVVSQISTDVYDKAMLRAIDKKAPCHKTYNDNKETRTKEEVRDTVIWLTFLKKSEKNKKIMFLSKDTDFCKDWIIHQDLINDLHFLWIDDNYIIWPQVSITDFLGKFELEDCPILTEEIIKTQILLPEEAMEYLKINKLAPDELITICKPSELYKITNIEKASWPELRRTQWINIISKDDWNYTFKFTMIFEYKFNVSEDGWRERLDWDGNEYLFGKIIYNIESQKYKLDYDSLTSEYDLIDLEEVIMEDIKREAGL